MNDVNVFRGSPMRAPFGAVQNNDWPVDRVAHDRYIEQISDHRVRPMNAGLRRWLDYLAALSNEHSLSASVGNAISGLWKALSSQIPTIYAPDASLTEDGTLLVSWIHDAHHLEIEVMPSARYVWFYRNHESNKDYIGEGTADAGATPELIEKARVVFA